MKLSFPEDFNKESYFHFWERTLILAEEWLGKEVNITYIDELPEIIPDFDHFMKWVGIFDPDIREFIEFHEEVRLRG